MNLNTFVVKYPTLFIFLLLDIVNSTSFSFYDLFYRHTLFYCASLFELHRYCIFYILKAYGSPVLSKSVGTIFLNSICSPYVSVSYFGDSQQYLKLFHYHCVCDGDL